MLDEDSSRFLERLLRMDATIRGHLEDKLFVVGLLLDAEVLYSILDIADGRIDRVDSDRL